MRRVTCKCGRIFQTPQPNRKQCYSCSPTRLSDVSERIQQKLNEQPVSLPTPGRITQVTVRELESLDKLDTVEGQIARSLALDLDGELPGSQRTSMSKQLTSMMEDIRATAPKEDTFVDSFREQLRQKRMQA